MGRIRKMGRALSVSCDWVRRRLSRPLTKLERRAHDETGQSTVEYLAVLIGIVAVVVGLASLLAAAKRGVFGRLASQALSHATGGSDPIAALSEVFLF
mgnify:CR=1 FL=1